ncbi:MAG: Mpo1-like protein [Woeseiaceae bacterium]
MSPSASSGFDSFAAFYPYYLAEHDNVICRRLHFVGSLLVISCLVAFAVTGVAGWLLAMPFCGYGFAWMGHFFFEKNRPATFRYPLYSLAGDWVMFKDILIGRVSLRR